MTQHRFIPLAAWLATAALIAGACGGSTRTASEPIVDEAELQSQLDGLIALGVPGAVLLVEDDDQTVTLTAGVSDLDTQTSVQPDDRFRIASLTKPYVATIVFQLAEENRLSIDDTVADWLPGAISNGDDVTIHELLNHTSGIADYFLDPVMAPYFDGDYSHVWTPQQLVEFATTEGSQFAPGSEYSYSNTDYTLLGLIVEKVTGHTMAGEMKTRIFDPLGLEHTTFAQDTHPDPSLIKGYLLGDDAPLDVTELYPFYWAAGNIVSDIADVATFFSALLDGELVDAASLDQMKPAVSNAAPGLGLYRRTYSCGSAFGHDGAAPGYNTDAQTLEGGRQALLFVNSITLDNKPTPDPASQERWTALMDAALCD
jgi:D-alanyl-D-alanine carboxypeptidase